MYYMDYMYNVLVLLSSLSSLSKKVLNIKIVNVILMLTIKKKLLYP